MALRARLSYQPVATSYILGLHPINTKQPSGLLTISDVKAKYRRYCGAYHVFSGRSGDWEEEAGTVHTPATMSEVTSESGFWPSLCGPNTSADIISVVGNPPTSPRCQQHVARAGLKVFPNLDAPSERMTCTTSNLCLPADLCLFNVKTYDYI